MSRLVRTLNGLKLCRLKSRHLRQTKHDPLYLFLRVIDLLAASGYSSSNTNLMAPLKDTKLVLLPRVSANVKALITLKLSLKLPNSLPSVAFLPLPSFVVGVSTKWMYKMPFFMGILLKKFT